MGKQLLYIKVHVDDDYVYMSAEDWQKIVKVLGKISDRWSISEKKESDSWALMSDEVH